MKDFRRKKFVGIFIFIAVFAAAIAIVMFLWNALMPSIIGWTTINYWQAAGLMILSRLLLGGFGRFGRFGGKRHHFKQKREEFRQWHMLRDQMKDMTKEERREYMRKHMRYHGFGGGSCGKDETREDNRGDDRRSAEYDG